MLSHELVQPGDPGQASGGRPRAAGLAVIGIGLVVQAEPAAGSVIYASTHCRWPITGERHSTSRARFDAAEEDQAAPSLLKSGLKLADDDLEESLTRW